MNQMDLFDLMVSLEIALAKQEIDVDLRMFENEDMSMQKHTNIMIFHEDFCTYSSFLHMSQKVKVN